MPTDAESSQRSNQSLGTQILRGISAVGVLVSLVGIAYTAHHDLLIVTACLVPVASWFSWTFAKADEVMPDGE